MVPGDSRSLRDPVSLLNSSPELSDRFVFGDVFSVRCSNPEPPRLDGYSGLPCL